MSGTAGELIHATAVMIGDRGVLIMGASGSGKSSLANALLDRALAQGRFAALISDDQCLVRGISSRLVCSAPPALRGGMEVRGSGLHKIDHEPHGVIHLVVHLVESARAVRFGENMQVQLQRVAIAQLLLPEREIESACRSVEAWLFKPYWKK